MGFRLRVAATALGLVVLSTAGPLCAPVLTRLALVTSAPADEADCCPAGSHRPGECPLHRKASAPASHNGSPRLTCGCRQDAAMLAPAGPIEPSLSLMLPAATRPALVSVDVAPRGLAHVPPSPPPRA